MHQKHRHTKRSISVAKDLNRIPAHGPSHGPSHGPPLSFPPSVSLTPFTRGQLVDNFNLFYYMSWVAAAATAPLALYCEGPLLVRSWWGRAKRIMGMQWKVTAVAGCALCVSCFYSRLFSSLTVFFASIAHARFSSTTHMSPPPASFAVHARENCFRSYG